MDKENRTGIQISHKPNEEITTTNGGIKIIAATKPIAANFTTNQGSVYILLDCSGSMKGKKLGQAKEGIVSFTRDAFKKEYRVGLIKFGYEAEHLCGPVNDIQIIENKTEGVSAGGSTNLTDAIKTAHIKLKDCTGLKAMVIATDGMPDNVKSSLKAADNVKADGIDIITIGTDDAKTEYLKRLASQSELSTKVTSDEFAQAITSAASLLMSPKGLQPK